MSEAAHDEQLAITWRPKGNRQTVTASVGNEVFTDELVLTRSADRDKFARKLIERFPALADSKEDVLRKLEAMAEETKSMPAERVGVADLEEIDVANVARPEQFYSQEVCGFTIPVTHEEGGRPSGKWLQYLVWANGKREVRELDRRIILPNGKTLWVNPIPPEPTVSMVRSLGGWSAASRRKFLSGASAPRPAAVFAKTCEQVARFIELPEPYAAETICLLALWTWLTYAYQAWSAVPYLYFGGAAGSGKTRASEVIKQMAFRPMCSSNMTASSLFRGLHERGGTLIADEAEQLSQQNSPNVVESNSIYLCGYKRGGQATRSGSESDNFRQQEFEVYSPKVLLAINELPHALASRCITITMFKAPAGSQAVRRRIDDDEDRWKSLRDDLHFMMICNGPKLIELSRLDACPDFAGRDAELWRPLLALASWIESDGMEGLVGRLLPFADHTIAFSKQRANKPTDELILKILLTMLLRGQKPSPKEVLAATKEEDPDLVYSRSPGWIAKQLRSFSIATQKYGGKRVYHTDILPHLREVIARHGFEIESTP